MDQLIERFLKVRVEIKIAAVRVTVIPVGFAYTRGAGVSEARRSRCLGA